MKLKFEVGKFYKTRCGSKSYAAAKNKDGTFICLTVDLDGDIESEGWHHDEDGTVCGLSPHDYDLISEWVEPSKPLEFWANVYQSSIYEEKPEQYILGCSTERKETEWMRVANKAAGHAFLRTAKFREVIE